HLHVVQRGRLGRRLVPSYPTDARKAKGDAGLVAAGLLCGIKGYFENQLLLHLADRAEARHRVLPDPFVEFLEFGVGETEIGLADGHDLVALPDAESVIGIIT